MIKDNEDHPGFIVRINRQFFLFETEEEMLAVLKRKGFKTSSITEGCRCLYNWNRGQCEIKCSNCTITLCEMVDTGKERVAHNIIVRQEANNLGW